MVRLWISTKGVLLSYNAGIWVCRKFLFSQSFPEGIKTIPDLTYLTVNYFNQTI